MYDAPAPPDVQPAEGDPAAVDSAIALADGSRAWVGLCCEPVSGTWYEVTPGSGQPAGPRPGYALDLDPSATRIAHLGHVRVVVSHLDGTVVAEQGFDDVQGSWRQPFDVAWADDDSLAVLDLVQDGEVDEFRLYVTDAGLDEYLHDDWATIEGTVDGSLPRLAGASTDGAVLVLPATANATALEAYDAGTLERRPSSDVVLPAPATFAWMEHGVLTWIGAAGDLHVGDAVVPGEYTWARPVD